MCVQQWVPLQPFRSDLLEVSWLRPGQHVFTTLSFAPSLHKPSSTRTCHEIPCVHLAQRACLFSGWRFGYWVNVASWGVNNELASSRINVTISYRCFSFEPSRSCRFSSQTPGKYFAIQSVRLSTYHQKNPVTKPFLGATYRFFISEINTLYQSFAKISQPKAVVERSRMQKMNYIARLFLQLASYHETS